MTAEQERGLVLPVLSKAFDIWRLDAWRFLLYGLFMVAVSLACGSLPLAGPLLDLALSGPLFAGLVFATHRLALKERPTVEDYLGGARQMAPLMALGFVSNLLVLGGTLLFVIPGLVLNTLFAVCIPAMALERTRLRDSIRRSVELVRGSFFQVLLLTLIFGLLQLVVGMPAVLDLLTGSQPLPGTLTPLLLGMVLLEPLGGIVTALIYFRLRGGTYLVIWRGSS